MFILYVFILCILTLYSYALVDPNLTLINNSYWVTFREVVIQLGYYQRDTSWFIYLFLIISSTRKFLLIIIRIHILRHHLIFLKMSGYDSCIGCTVHIHMAQHFCRLRLYLLFLPSENSFLIMFFSKYYSH